MYCPHCGKQISDSAVFCGYCGKTIAPAPAPVQSEPPKPPKKKKRVGIVVLVIFLIIALLAGGVLGFLAARGTLNFKKIFRPNEMRWSDSDESYREQEKEDADEEPDAKDDEPDEEGSDDEEPDDVQEPDDAGAAEPDEGPAATPAATADPWVGNWIFTLKADGSTLLLDLQEDGTYSMSGRRGSDYLGSSAGDYLIVDTIEELTPLPGLYDLEEPPSILCDVSGQKLVMCVSFGEDSRGYFVFIRRGAPSDSAPDEALLGEWYPQYENDSMTLTITADGISMKGETIDRYMKYILVDGNTFYAYLPSDEAGDNLFSAAITFTYDLRGDELDLTVYSDAGAETTTFVR